MKRRTPIIAVLVVMLVVGVSVGSAWAYFTDSATAEGGLLLSVKPTTSMTEVNGPNSKTICIQNKSDMVSVWIRARAYAPKDLGLTAEGTNWELKGDWYVYKVPLAAKTETEPLNVTFHLENAFVSTGGPREGDEVSVTVLYESLPVTYKTNEAGETVPSDAIWKD